MTVLAVAEVGYKETKDKNQDQVFVSFYDMKDATKDDVDVMEFEHFECFERLEVDLSSINERIAVQRHTTLKVPSNKANA